MMKAGESLCHKMALYILKTHKDVLSHEYNVDILSHYGSISPEHDPRRRNQ